MTLEVAHQVDTQRLRITGCETVELPQIWRDELRIGPLCHIEPLSEGRVGMRILARDLGADKRVMVLWGPGPNQVLMELKHHRDDDRHYVMAIFEADEPIIDLIIRLAEPAPS